MFVTYLPAGLAADIGQPVTAVMCRPRPRPRRRPRPPPPPPPAGVCLLAGLSRGECAARRGGRVSDPSVSAGLKAGRAVHMVTGQSI